MVIFGFPFSSRTITSGNVDSTLNRLYIALLDKRKPTPELAALQAFFVTEDVTTILDINYVEFLQFQQYFIPQEEVEEAFIYIIHKPIHFAIDFLYRHKT